jgi:serine/threonine protein kinase
MRAPLLDPKAPVATRLGAYEIVSRLAAGGMAQLYLARITGPQGFEKLVVLKKILPHLADTPRYVRLLLDEAKLGACLEHPNIVQVHDIGLLDGHYFYAMEYVHGHDLETVLQRTAGAQLVFPVEHAVMIARDLASALHYAHNRLGPDGGPLNIVHRDVSTSNIQLSYDGGVKLLDFGIAKAESSTIRTRTGTIKGKAGYMSPEQAKCEPMDRRTDVYSLGIVLWEMLAGRRLYEATTELRKWELVLKQTPVPPSEFRRRQDCPPELDAIVLRALAHPLDERFQTARDLQIELEELARAHRLKQSSIGLSEYMNLLFDSEIRVSEQRDAAAETRTDQFATAKRRDSGELLEEEPTRSLQDATTIVRSSPPAMLPPAPAPPPLPPPPLPLPPVPARPAAGMHDDSILALLSEEPTRPKAGIADPPPPPVIVFPAAPVQPRQTYVMQRVERTTRAWAQIPSRVRQIVLIVLGALALMILTAVVVRRIRASSAPASTTPVVPNEPTSGPTAEPAIEPPAPTPEIQMESDSTPARSRKHDR